MIYSIVFGALMIGTIALAWYAIESGVNYLNRYMEVDKDREKLRKDK